MRRNGGGGAEDVGRPQRPPTGVVAAPTGLSLRLYVAGFGPNSVAARSNLAAILAKDSGSPPVALEVVDILESPGKALADGITATPTLVRLWPLPMLHIVGNLKNQETVRLALGLGA